MTDCEIVTEFKRVQSAAMDAELTLASNGSDFVLWNRPQTEMLFRTDSITAMRTFLAGIRVGRGTGEIFLRTWARRRGATSLTQLFLNDWGRREPDIIRIESQFEFCLHMFRDGISSDFQLKNRDIVGVDF